MSSNAGRRWRAVGDHDQADALAGGHERQHDQRADAGAAQHLVAGEAAAGGVADGVGRRALVDPDGHRGELVRLELAERDRERALGEVRVQRAVAVGQRDDRGLVAGQLERAGQRLAHDALGVLRGREPRR